MLTRLCYLCSYDDSDGCNPFLEVELGSYSAHVHKRCLKEAVDEARKKFMHKELSEMFNKEPDDGE